MKTIIIADDHPVTLNGMKTFLEQLGYIVMYTCDNGINAFNQINAFKPDYAILDLNMPGLNGLEVLEKIRQTNKTTKVIIYTMYNEKALFEKAVKLGVNGFLLKDFAIEEFELCLEALSHQKFWFSPKLEQTLSMSDQDNKQEKFLLLSPAERKIVSMIADEKSSKTIAEQLFISEKTVENHRSNIIKKLNLSTSKNSLLIWALENKRTLG